MTIFPGHPGPLSGVNGNSGIRASENLFGGLNLVKYYIEISSEVQNEFIIIYQVNISLKSIGMRQCNMCYARKNIIISCILRKFMVILNIYVCCYCGDASEALSEDFPGSSGAVFGSEWASQNNIKHECLR